MDAASAAGKTASLLALSSASPDHALHPVRDPAHSSRGDDGLVCALLRGCCELFA